MARQVDRYTGIEDVVDFEFKADETHETVFFSFDFI